MCVRERERKRKREYIHCTYCFPCSQAAPGTPVCVCVCVRGGKRCVRLYLESLQTPSSPLLSPPSVLSAWRICQFSCSLFVPALILLSKPWLASLTAAEHRSYSTPTNNTHPCHAGMMRVHRHRHTRTRTHLHTPTNTLTRCSTYSPSPLSHTPKSVTTGSAIIQRFL